MSVVGQLLRAMRFTCFVIVAAVFAMPLSAAEPGCAGKPDCLDNASFSAQVTDFRISASGRYRLVTATVRIHNRLARPLTLGYVGNSGVVTDDLGNRYLIGSSGVRGMGVLGAGAVDTKFTLDPGESSDARFEFIWEPGHAVVGTRFEMDLALREIDAIAGGQVRLGRERVLHFAAPAVAAPGGGAVATAGSLPAATPATAAADVPVTPAADPCAGLPRCASGGPFLAQVTSVVAVGTPKDRHHSLRLTVRFRNISNAPLHLGYKATSSAAIDNLGNRYAFGRPGTHDTSAAGIGIIEGRSADPSFALNPGESRDAQFSVTRFNSLGQQIGTAWVYDVVVAGLVILPSQQVRLDRDYSLHFADLSAGAIAGVPGAGPIVNDAVRGILNLLDKKK